MKEWQPIETAPKDKWILVSGPSGVDVSRWFDDIQAFDPRDVTYWMPLPDPPSVIPERPPMRTQNDELFDQLVRDHSAAMELVRELAARGCNRILHGTCGKCLPCRAEKWLNTKTPETAV